MRSLICRSPTSTCVTEYIYEVEAYDRRNRLLAAELMGLIYIL
jgi:hypothetical protein